MKSTQSIQREDWRQNINENYSQRADMEFWDGNSRSKVPIWSNKVPKWSNFWRCDGEVTYWSSLDGSMRQEVWTKLSIVCVGATSKFSVSKRFLPPRRTSRLWIRTRFYSTVHWSNIGEGSNSNPWFPSTYIVHKNYSVSIHIKSASQVCTKQYLLGIIQFRGSRRVVICFSCGMSWHIACNCPNNMFYLSVNYAEGDTYAWAIDMLDEAAFTEYQYNNWHMDSRASHHIIAKKARIEVRDDSSATKNVTTVDGSAHCCHHVG